MGRPEWNQLLFLADCAPFPSSLLLLNRHARNIHLEFLFNAQHMTCFNNPFNPDVELFLKGSIFMLIVVSKPLGWFSEVTIV